MIILYDRKKCVAIIAISGLWDKNWLDNSMKNSI